MSIEVKHYSNCSVIRINSELSISNLMYFDNLLTKLFTDGIKLIGIDMSRVSFIDSSAIGSLVKYISSNKKSEVYGRVILIDLSEIAERILKTAKLYPLLNIVTFKEFARDYCPECNEDY